MAQNINASSWVNFPTFGFLNAKTANVLLNQDIGKLCLDAVCVNESFFNCSQVVVMDRPTVPVIIVNKYVQHSVTIKGRDRIIIMLEFNTKKVFDYKCFKYLQMFLWKNFKRLNIIYISVDNKLILVGDLKAKHYLWGNEKSDNNA